MARFFYVLDVIMYNFCKLGIFTYVVIVFINIQLNSFAGWRQRQCA